MLGEHGVILYVVKVEVTKLQIWELSIPFRVFEIQFLSKYDFQLSYFPGAEVPKMFNILKMLKGGRNKSYLFHHFPQNTL
jgi:hypothetical protein